MAQDDIIRQWNCRRTGSSYLRSLLTDNYHVQVVSDEKHGAPTTDEDWNYYLVTMRNPYAWVVSVLKFDQIPKENWTSGLIHTYVDNWGRLNRMYYEFVESLGHDAAILRYETWYNNLDMVKVIANSWRLRPKGNFKQTDIVYSVDKRKYHEVLDYWDNKRYLDELGQYKYTIKNRLQHKNHQETLKLLGYSDDYNKFFR